MNYSKPIALTTRANAEPVRVLVIGSRGGVQETIDQLCGLGFCDHAQWSRIQPKPETGEYMAIMTKWRI
jgi:hypothetical protein